MINNSRNTIDIDLKDNKNDNKERSKTLIDDVNIYIVKSPIVGTFYEGSSPDAPAFIKVGDKVD